MGYIGKVDIGGTQHLVASTLYGTCSTAATTAAKTVTLADFDQLINGTTIHIYFTNDNTAENPTLNVNNTGAIPIKRYGTTAPQCSTQAWAAGQIVSFTYYEVSSTDKRWIMNDIDQRLDVLTGTGEEAQDKGAGVSPRYFPAKWKFNLGKQPNDGDIITIRIPCAGHSYGVYISLDNGTNYKPVSTINTTKLTTHFASEKIISLVYESDGQTNTIYNINGGDTTINVTGGCWSVLNFYDSNTRNTAGSTNTSDKIFLIGAKSQSANPQTYSDNQVYVTNGSLYLTKETDAEGLKDNKPALLIGNPAGTHLELDTNEVMAKSSATTTGPLYINNNGGLVYANSKKVVRLTSDPTSGQVMIADGIDGQIKSSGYTISANVPSGAAFTDTWRNIKVNGTEKLGTGTGTGTLNFKNGTNTTVTYDSGIQINATDSKVTQTLNNAQDSYYPLLFSKKTIDDDDAETTDTVYRSNNVYINPNGYLYAKNLQIGGGTDSGTLTLYKYSGGGFVLGELTQPFSISGGTITHSLPLISGNLFGSGNLIAGAGITLEDSAGLYTISTKNDIVLREVNLDNSNIDKVDNYIAIDEFVSSPDKKYYIEIYYTDNNGKNPGIAKIPLTTGMVPQSLETVGNEFTLSITGDINTTYIRTSHFKFKTPSNSSQQIRLYGQSSYIVTFDNPSGTSSETKNSYTIQRKTVSNGNYTGFWVVPYKMRFIQEK